ncbi:MAB_1171c family putative transporter [Nocardia brasiliensis]|uniref:MAB_1171c family putative transporter n=1 Tax=Nocardia brasiliensis TaxID=37326 RepID=UPI00366E2F98
MDDNARTDGVRHSAVASACLVTIARWVLADSTPAAHLINRALSWLSVGAVVQQFAVATNHPGLAVQVFLFCAPMAVANVYGLARLFVGVDPDVARGRQRIYDAVAAAAGLLVLLTGRPEDHGTGFSWRTVVYWVIFNVPLMAAGAHIIRACLRDLWVLRIRTSLPEKLAYFGLLLLSAGWFLGAAVAAVQSKDGTVPGSVSARWSWVSCLFCVLVVLLTAVPLVHLALARTGWDRIGRDLRRLQPMWRDLTAAVPEIVLPSGTSRGRDPESRRYRMIVEIRDALLHLRPHLSAGADAASSARGYAVQIARAAQAKSAGIAPVGLTSATDYHRITVHDRTSELGQLLALAREWPRARAEVSGRGPASRQ